MPAKQNSGRLSSSANQTTSFFLVSGFRWIVRKNAGHRRQVADVPVHAPKESGDGGLISGDAVKITHSAFTFGDHDTLLAAFCSNDLIMMPLRILPALARIFLAVASGIGGNLYVATRSVSSLCTSNRKPRGSSAISETS